MPHVIETIGRWGIRTTPMVQRSTKPGPGDPVDISHLTGYPWTDRKRAYIASIDNGRASLCIGSCSMFLDQDGDVSISGGPFGGCDLDQLQPTASLEPVRMWNWGDHSAGAGQGVDYLIIRPLFRLEL